MEKKIVTNPPKGIEGQTIELEFVGNLDIAIQKMKRNAFLELEDTQILQLKCCLLFLCGMPFSKISEQLSVSKGTISRYLNDTLLEGLLSFEYRILLQMNRFRLQPENKNEKMKRAVQVFIEQNGDYQKTAELTGFSDRTLSRYFSDSKLPEILESETLYQQFMDVKNSHISEIKSQAAISNIKQQSLKSLIAVLNPNGIVEKRYLALCNAMLIEGIEDIKGLMEYTGMSKANIESYLLDVSKSAGLFPQPVLEVFTLKALQIRAGKENEFLLEEFERNIISLYQAGRYSYEEISEIVGIKNSRIIADIINEKAKQLLTAEEYVELQRYKAAVSLLLQAPAQNKCLIKDPKMISIVKPELVFVSPLEFQILATLVQFLNIYENIRFEDPKGPLNIMEANLLVHLPILKTLLNEEYYKKVDTILYVEKLLFGNQLQLKYEYIMKVVKGFFLNNLNIEETAIKEEIPIEVLIRVLQSNFVEMNYGNIISEYINQAIRKYQTQNQKGKSEKTYVYR